MTDTLPKVSVVCAWYNRADYIHDTIDSLLTQDYPNFDITVVNDGSPDPRVREILDNYDDPRLRVIHQENMGFTRTIRRAIDESDGEYIAIQGAGDVSLPRRLSAQVAVFEQQPETVASATGYALVDPNSRKVVQRSKLPERVTNESLATGLPITHGTYMYKRDAYIAAGGYNPAFRFAQDWEFLTRVARIGQINVVPGYHYERLIFEDGATYSPRKRLVQRVYCRAAKQAALQADTHWGELEQIDVSYPTRARNLLPTLRMAAGACKRRTFRDLPELGNLLMRQTLNTLRLKF